MAKTIPFELKDNEIKIIRAMLNYKQGEEEYKTKKEDFEHRKKKKKSKKPQYYKKGWLNVREIRKRIEKKENKEGKRRKILHDQNVRKYLRGDEGRTAANKTEGLLKKRIVQEKEFEAYFDGRRLANKWLFRLRPKIQTFLKLYVLFYDLDALEEFEKSDYYRDNYNKALVEYHFIMLDVFGTIAKGKEKKISEDWTTWFKKKIANEVVQSSGYGREFTRRSKNITQRARTGLLSRSQLRKLDKKRLKLKTRREDPSLFYFYAKDRKRFKDVIISFIKRFNEVGIRPSHFNQLLLFSLELTRDLNRAFDSPGKKIDYKKFARQYEIFIKWYVLGDYVRYLKKEELVYMEDHSPKDKKPIKTRRRKVKK